MWILRLLDGIRFETSPKIEYKFAQNKADLKNAKIQSTNEEAKKQNDDREEGINLMFRG